ncbi:IS21-like element helper ATPase IstB [Globicatella sanguinis]
MTIYLKVQEQLEYLKFKSAQHYLEQLYQNHQMTVAELSGLYKILAKEVEAKEENNRLYNVKVAALPYLKTIDDYDFTFQPSIEEDQIRTIIESSFYNEAKNVVLVGNPGTGKTHLAIAISYSVAIKRNSVYFIKFSKLIHSLRTAYQEGTLERKIKLFFKYKLLVIDEVGFNEISPLEAKLFFQLIDMRYTKRSTIFTSNLTFDKWHTIMGQDEMLTKAIIDRILHHSYLINITGPSYRIKDKLSPRKSGES